jgi:hypothetical protein
LRIICANQTIPTTDFQSPIARADASVWSSVASVLCPHFETPIRTHALSHANLVAYAERGMRRWFPEIAT